MSNNASKKLLKASTEATVKGVQHVLAIVKPDGSFDMSGSDNIIKAIMDNADLYQSLHGTVTANRQEGGEVLPVNVLTFPFLPCSPYSKAWKGSAMIRRVLDSVVTAAGYGMASKDTSLGRERLLMAGQVTLSGWGMQVQGDQV